MLTDDEAAFLKSLRCEANPYERTVSDDLFGWGYITYNLPDGSPCLPRLEPDGELALAEYEAAHVTVKREDLRELRRRCADIKYMVSIRAALEALEKGEPLPPEGEE